MGDSPKKSTRELVTLPPDLAERVEAFREKTGMVSKSESLKMLIEGGLRRYDSRDDLFQRCAAATHKGQSLGDIINTVTADHPLVQSTSLDSDSLLVFLRSVDDEADERFRFARAAKRWSWEYLHPSDHDWRVMERIQPAAGGGGRPSASGMDDDISGGGRPKARGGKAELDDDIPF